MDQIDIRKSLIMAGICISVAIIGAEAISSYVYTKTIIALVDPKQIIVTGKAEKEVKSDLVVWSGTVSREGKDAEADQAKLSEDVLKLKKFFLSRGIKENEISQSSLTMEPVYKKDADGYDTKIESDSVTLTQTMEIRSSDTDKVERVSVEIVESKYLGVPFAGETIKYFRTNTDDLKLETYALATENARAMAQGLAKRNGNKLGALSSMETGVFKIVSAGATDPYEESSDDSTSANKKATAIVTAVFEVK